MVNQKLKLVEPLKEKSYSLESLDLNHILASLNLITNDQLAIVKEEQKNKGKSFRDTIITLGILSEQTINEVIAQQGGFKSIDLEKTVIDHELIKQLPRHVAEQRLILPITIEDSILHLAMTDAYDIRALDQAKKYFPQVSTITPVLTTASNIHAAIDRYYGYDLSFDRLLHELEHAAKLDDSSYTWVSPVVRFVEVVLLNGVKLKASDIHFQPEETFVRLRYRIDGILKQHCAFHKSYWSSICVRLKVLATMNLAESRRPQNGRYTITHGLRNIDFRVSCHPTVHGESIVLRILDQQNSLRDLEELGFSNSHVSKLKGLANRSQGLFVITGPTGSGKTTTMYSLLRYLNSAQLNIMTLEQPVEYKLPMIRQSEVPEAGYTTFADGVRSILRQDPDILFIGEIRDEETAKMALRAAMTGHLVFTTLHTNDCLSVLPRLKDLGLKPSMVAPYLICAVSQRLVRLLCPSCGSNHDQASKGCAQCHYTGFQGRKAVAELLEFTTPLQQAIADDLPLVELKTVARKLGFKTMAQEGEYLVESGLTTTDELLYQLGSAE